jgi:hypothetical protein
MWYIFLDKITETYCGHEKRKRDSWQGDEGTGRKIFMA